MKFGFSEFTTWPWSFEEDVREYKAAGAEWIEVCEFKLAQQEYARGLRLAADSGLTVGSVQAKIHSIFPDSMESMTKEPRDRLAAIKNAITLSAPSLPKGTPFIIITGIAPEANMRKAVDATIDALKELGDFAGEHGMKIAFEPLNPINLHLDTAVWGLDRGLALVERVNNPNVGICIDTWNIWETPDLYDVIAACGKRILVIQASDWKMPRSPADRYSLGDGDLPLAGIFRAIRKTGFDGPWVVEILSSLHLEGSLWKGDMKAMLRANRDAFMRLWEESSV
jgi:sugar phosphate isomerase/epimerase